MTEGQMVMGKVLCHRDLSQSQLRLIPALWIHPLWSCQSSVALLFSYLQRVKSRTVLWIGHWCVMWHWGALWILHYSFIWRDGAATGANSRTDQRESENHFPLQHFRLSTFIYWSVAFSTCIIVSQYIILWSQLVIDERAGRKPERWNLNHYLIRATSCCLSYQYFVIVLGFFYDLNFPPLNASPGWSPRAQSNKEIYKITVVCGLSEDEFRFF